MTMMTEKEMLEFLVDINTGTYADDVASLSRELLEKKYPNQGVPEGAWSDMIVIFCERKLKEIS